MNALEALNRARRAWERVDMQTSMDLWPDSGLDEREPRALPLVEPASAPSPPTGGGLTVGAEPCCGTPSGLTAGRSLHGPARIVSGGSAPLTNQTAPGRTSPEDVRGQGQEVEL